MAIDIARVAPAELVRLLNSTPLGEVITERQLYRHRQTAGLRIGDGHTVHLLRYVSWLIQRLQRRAGEGGAMTDADRTQQAQQYERHKARAAKRQADIAEAGQEIGPPPPVVDPQRRAECERDFRRFCETYFAPVFKLAWSKDHLRAIAKIERAVLANELFALAMPRGSGKTSLCLVAVIWAAVYGHHRFICLIAATERRARKLLQIGIYRSLERNPLLMEDFPEVCFPVKKLERTPQRAAKQKCEGHYTSIVWTKNEIVLPTITRPDGSTTPASGTIITVCGLTGGEVRGQVKDMPDGTMARPTLVLLDDPQTKASAKSVTQSQDRVELLQGDVLGMAGPDRAVAGMMPCTVIRPLDMADEILDTEKNPEWHGERTKLVYRFPDNEPLWEEYTNLRKAGLRRGDASAATEFYLAHRAAMDAGAEIAWPERYWPDKGEVSAVQHAMNLLIRHGEAMFFAEFQNDPLVSKEEDDLLDADAIAAKLNRRAESTLPTSCTRLTMFVDVQKKLLYYAIIAFEPNFTAYVIEYGSWPDQRQHHFLYRSVRRTLQTAHRGHGEEAAILAGLEALTAEKISRTWTRDDGAAMRITACLVDAGYQKDTVELFCRQSKHAGTIMPSKGLPISAASIPLDERKRKKGEEVGENWRLTGRQGEHSVRLMLFDANHWKSFVHARLAVPMGGKGCLSLWGKSEARHRMIADHLTAEYRTRTEGRGRTVYQWECTPGRDNHLLDCVAGCMVAASYAGCRVVGDAVPRGGPKRPRRSLSDLLPNK